MYPRSYARARPRRRRWWPRFLSIAAVGLLAGAAWMYWPRGEGDAERGTSTAKLSPAAASIVPEAILVEHDKPAGSITPPWGAAEAKPTKSDTDAASAKDEPLRAESGTPAATGNRDGPPGSPTAALDDAKPKPHEAEPPRAAPDNESKASPPIAAAANPKIAAALERYKSGDRIAAREELNNLLSASPTGPAAGELRRHLASIAEETIFSRKRLDGDPLTDSYTIHSGDRPIAIARQFDMSHEVLMSINGLTDVRQFREGETIKVLKGPFHARVYLSEFRLDLYLQDLYLRSFRVGLGRDDSTPEGVWKVVKRQKDPTYYPPASATDKRVIAPNDPANPLGGYWIGLEGASGEALGKKSYGIHGTIEPDTIGRSASMGCIRMLNEDVGFVFGVVREGKSTVTILP